MASKSKCFQQDVPSALSIDFKYKLPIGYLRYAYTFNVISNVISLM